MVKLFVSKKLQKDLPRLWREAYGEELDERKLHKLYFCVSTIHLWRVMRDHHLHEGVPVNSHHFRQVLQKQYPLLEQLCEIPMGENVTLIRRSPYSPSKDRSKGESTKYCVHAQYSKDIKSIKIEDKQLERNMGKLRNPDAKDRFYTDEISENVLQTLSYVTFARSLRSPEVEILEEKDKRENKLDPSNRQSLVYILTQLPKAEKIQYVFFSHRTRNGNRLFHTFSNIRAEFRAHIRIQGLETSEIDVGSSQPLMMLGLIRQHGDGSKEFRINLEKYEQSVRQGRFYEDLRLALNSFYGVDFTFEGRNYSDFKDLVYEEIFFGSIYSKKSKFIYPVFVDEYPELSKVVRSLKKGKGGHKRFAQKVQSMEASIVLDAVGSQLIQEGIRFLPIHDSLIVPKCHTKRVKSLLSKAIEERIGIKPTLTVKNRRNRKPRSNLGDEDKR